MNFPTKKEIKKAKAGGIVQIDEEKYSVINEPCVSCYFANKDNGCKAYKRYGKTPCHNQPMIAFSTL